MLLNSNPKLSWKTALIRKRVLTATNIALVSLGYFLTALVLLHFLRQDYDPLIRFMSEYAVGKYGFIMTSAFFALSLASFSLAYSLLHIVSKNRPLKIALRFLNVWSLSVLMAGLFTSDLSTAPKTSIGMVHDISSLIAFLSIPVAAMLLPFALKQDKYWCCWYQCCYRFRCFLCVFYNKNYRT